MRAEGWPSGVAVESVIASGSGTPAATAASYQAANWRIGSESMPASSRAACSYSLRAWVALDSIVMPFVIHQTDRVEARGPSLSPQPVVAPA